MQSVLIQNSLIESIEEMINRISTTSNRFNFNFLYVPQSKDCALQLYYKDLSNSTIVIMLNKDIDDINILLCNIINTSNNNSLAYNLAKEIIHHGKRVI